MDATGELPVPSMMRRLRYNTTIGLVGMLLASNVLWATDSTEPVFVDMSQEQFNLNAQSSDVLQWQSNNDSYGDDYKVGAQVNPWYHPPKKPQKKVYPQGHDLPGVNDSRFITPEELSKIEGLSYQSPGMWTDNDAQAHSNEPAWGRLDTSGLMGQPGSPLARRYAPDSAYGVYRQQRPEWNNYSPGMMNNYRPDNYMNMYPPQFGGSYMNNSLAPFLY